MQKVSPYCPECGGPSWMYVNHGRADYNTSQVRKRCCVHCLAKGKVTTW